MSSTQDYHKLSEEKKELERSNNKLQNDFDGLDKGYRSLEEKLKRSIKEFEEEKRKHAETKESLKKAKDANDKQEEYIASVEEVASKAEETVEEQKAELSTSQQRLEDARAAKKEVDERVEYLKGVQDGLEKDIVGVRKLLLVEKAKNENFKKTILSMQANAAVFKDAKDDLHVTRLKERGIEQIVGRLKDDLAQNGFDPSPHAYLQPANSKTKPAKTLEEEINLHGPMSGESGSTVDLSDLESSSSEVESSQDEDEDDTIKSPAGRSPKRKTERPQSDEPAIKTVYVEVPGPERIVEVEVPGPERIVQVEVEVPGPERETRVEVPVPTITTEIVYRETPQPHHQAWRCWTDLYLNTLATISYFAHKRSDIMKLALINVWRAQQGKHRLRRLEPKPDPALQPVPTGQQIESARMHREISVRLRDLTPLPQTPGEREQLEGEMPPEHSPDIGPVMFSTNQAGNLQQFFDGLQAVDSNDDAREQLPGELPPVRRQRGRPYAPFIGGPFTSPKPLTWSRDSILHPEPEQLPPTSSLFGSLLFHFIVYACIIAGFYAYHERKFWLDANEYTNTFLFQLLGGRKNPTYGIDFLLGTFVNESWRRRGEIWVWKYVVRALGLEVHYALPG